MGVRSDDPASAGAATMIALPACPRFRSNADVRTNSRVMGRRLWSRTAHECSSVHIAAKCREVSITVGCCSNTLIARKGDHRQASLAASYASTSSPTVISSHRRNPLRVRISASKGTHWAMLSTRITPGTMGFPGKCPAWYHSAPVKVCSATARTPGSSSVTRSMSRNGSRCGMSASMPFRSNTATARV